MRQRPGADLAEAIELGEVFNANDGVGHGEWSRGGEGRGVEGWSPSSVYFRFGFSSNRGACWNGQLRR